MKAEKTGSKIRPTKTSDDGNGRYRQQNMYVLYV
jgi:hypothetical protein